MPDSIDVGSDCSFRYEGLNGCVSRGSYSEPIADQGSVQVSIDSSTNGACLPAGEYSCSYSASSTRLTFACAGTAFSYAR